MLRTNLSYAGLQLFASQFSQAIDDQVAAWNAAAAEAQQLGFEVTAVDDTTVVPSGPAGVPVAFDLTNFDITGNVTNPTTFTLQASGEYAGYGQIIFSAGDSGTRTVTITQNGIPIATVSSDPLAQPTTPPEPLTLYFTFTGDFQQGDVIQVIASHNLSSSQDVLPGSFFSMIQTSASGTAINVGSSNTDGTKNFTAEVTVQPLTVVRVLPDGNVTPIDPFIPVITGVSEDASNLLTITCNAHHFVSGDHVVFSGLQNAAYLNNIAVTVLAGGLSGTQFTAIDPTGHGSFTEPVSPPVAETGSVLYANDSGSVLAPNPDGITTDGAPALGTVPVGVRYGGLFQVTQAQAAAVSGKLPWLHRRRAVLRRPERTGDAGLFHTRSGLPSRKRPCRLDHLRRSGNLNYRVHLRAAHRNTIRQLLLSRPYNSSMKFSSSGSGRNHSPCTLRCANS